MLDTVLSVGVRVGAYILVRQKINNALYASNCVIKNTIVMGLKLKGT